MIEFHYQALNVRSCPASILRKSTSGRHRPVSYPDGPMTARYRFTSNADWVACLPHHTMFFSIVNSNLKLIYLEGQSRNRVCRHLILQSTTPYNIVVSLFLTIPGIGLKMGMAVNLSVFLFVFVCQVCYIFFF